VKQSSGLNVAPTPLDCFAKARNDEFWFNLAPFDRDPVFLNQNHSSNNLSIFAAQIKSLWVKPFNEWVMKVT
jgi:hypothetical protein